MARKTKKEAKTTAKGAVELQEEQLEDVQGGLLPAVKPTDSSLNFTVKLNDPSLNFTIKL